MDAFARAQREWEDREPPEYKEDFDPCLICQHDPCTCDEEYESWRDRQMDRD
jgi:hypothetical protein